MTTIHNIAAYAHGGLSGAQASQRDWSPFLAHFTSWKSMEVVRLAVAAGEKPAGLAALLASADADSFEVVKKIASSGKLLARQPSDKKGNSHDIPACVCLSECNLPGLLSHCERYGRFGFVIAKADAFAAGTRPCMYVDTDIYELLDKTYSASTNPVERRLFGLANVFSPPGSGRIQDYTHEREWRHFGDLDLTSLAAILCPSAYIPQVRTLYPDKTLIPLDMLHQWGA